MLKKHAYYVYHQENRVMARRGSEEPVVAMVCKPITIKDEKSGEETVIETAAQVAHDEVQKIVNPKQLDPQRLKDAKGRVVGFHQAEFQAAISANCRVFVEEAYARAAAAATTKPKDEIASA